MLLKLQDGIYDINPSNVLWVVFPAIVNDSNNNCKRYKVVEISEKQITLIAMTNLPFTSQRKKHKLPENLNEFSKEFLKISSTGLFSFTADIPVKIFASKKEMIKYNYPK